MVRARQKPGVWWPGRQQRHCSTKAPTCITLSRCPPRQKHEPRARRQSKSKSKTVSPPPLSDIPILRTEPPSLQPFIPHPASGTSQSRVVIRSCHLEHLCAAVPNQTKPNQTTACHPHFHLHLQSVRFLHLTCRLQKSVLLLGATLLRTQPKAPISDTRSAAV
jgi:hypothetical protein